MLSKGPPGQRQVDQAEPTGDKIEVHPLTGMSGHEGCQQRSNETPGTVASMYQSQPAMGALQPGHEDVCLRVLVSLAQRREDEGDCEQCKGWRLSC